MASRCFVALHCGKESSNRFQTKLKRLTVEKRTANATALNFRNKNWMLCYDNYIFYLLVIRLQFFLQT